MNVFLVLPHPAPKSFNGALLDTVLRTLTFPGYTTDARAQQCSRRPSAAAVASAEA